MKPLLVTWKDVPGSSVRPLRDAWTMLRDIRGIRTTHYENIVVDLAPDVRARGRRDGGARGASPRSRAGPWRRELSAGRRTKRWTGRARRRDGLEGPVRTATLAELRGRLYEAV